MGSRAYRLVGLMTLEIRSQPIGRFVTTGSILLQALHHDPIQIAPQQFRQFGRFH